MPLSDKSQKLSAIGTDNKTAGENLIDQSININNFNMVEKYSKLDFAIGDILMGISRFQNDIKYEIPNTQDYTIEDKIDYNELSKYKHFFEDYMENYSLVRKKIDTFTDEDPLFDRVLIQYVKSKYQKYFREDTKSDTVLNNIIEDIEKDLRESTNLSPDDLCYVNCVVFYVFAECKIFKPP
ncbi:ABC-three component system protein, partial [Helicobacter sp. 13S00482-2]|uniref:ABC-three component system protein n=1 Tax=Helicobacter sp. 13S00482-2 TaxID=1476200 RepID=UPI00117B1B8C